MKFVIYNGQKKITIDNAWLPEEENFVRMMDDFQAVGLTMEDLRLYEMRITATRGMNLPFDSLNNLQIEKEIIEGINCRQETVN